ncbi:hypothetical protein [Candidatus Poriferisodalis sp.]|uniref:hypothetical protein n=1 Tax=Candidatus Poriferisodalis sp. TaxID=3101277 RepID=UPI003B5202BC
MSCPRQPIALGENGDSLIAFIYDMVLHAANADRCLDAGIIAFSKVQRTANNRYAPCRLKGDHGNDAPFVTTADEKVVPPLFAIDGTPAIKIVDGGTAYDGMPAIRVTDGMNDANRMPNRHRAAPPATNEETHPW